MRGDYVVVTPNTARVYVGARVIAYNAPVRPCLIVCNVTLRVGNLLTIFGNNMWGFSPLPLGIYP